MNAAENGTAAAHPARSAGRTLFNVLCRVSQSLEAKLFAVVFLVLMLNLGVLGYANVELHRKHLEAARLADAQRMSHVVQRSTSYSMMRNHREGLAHIVDAVGGEPGFLALRIMDHRGRVAFSSDPGEIGRRILVRGAHSEKQVTSVDRTAGRRSLSVTTPIRNSPQCSSGECHAHPASQQLLGVLDLTLSLEEAEADVRTASWQFVALSALAILLTLLAIGLLMWQLVHKPIRRLRRGTESLSRGDLGVQIPVRSRDDLGQLADSFNEMSRQLRAAREESNSWAQTLETRVRRKTAELERAQEQMIQVEKLTSLGKLAAVVAHEINNPLSGILTYAKLLRKWIERGDSLEERSAEMRESLQLIESESRRCGDIVRNLLMFARVPPLNLSDFDVNEVVRRTMKLVEHKLDLGNITPRLELAADLPQLHGDLGQVEQFLLALIMNAIEAMPREGQLRIRTSASDPDSLTIEISDDGVGIPDDLLPRLFEPFTTTKEHGKGVGLGLAISKTIVERHGGKIAVSSAVGRGTTFTITLPVGRSGEGLRDQNVAERGAGSGTALLPA